MVRHAVTALTLLLCASALATPRHVMDWWTASQYAGGSGWVDPNLVDLIAHYNTVDGSNNAVDETGITGDATPTGTPMHSGGYFSFDDGDYYNLPANSMELPDGGTVMMWVRYTSQNLLGIFSIKDANNWSRFYLRTEGSGAIYTEGWQTLVKQFDLRVAYETYRTTWHHIAVTMEPNAFHTYYDGVLEQSDTSGTHVGYSSTHAARLGYDFGVSKSFQGDIFDVRIYDTAIAAEEVLEVFSNGPQP